MRATGYAYPWDVLDDDTALERAVALGVDRVALAATYHASRFVTPLHPRRRVLEVPHSAMYTPIREEAWRTRRLTPRPADWLASLDPFNDAARRIRATGLPLVAWIVLTHDDNVASENLDLVVRNAWGEFYPYALCPSHDEVRRYCATVAEEVLATAECDGVVLEACGPLGLDHESLHDKSAMAELGESERALLSLCFCGACRAGLSGVEIDPDALAASVRTALSGPPASMEAALGGELATRLAAFRSALSSSLRRLIVARSTRPDATITLHASSSPWATGSFPALGAAPAAGEISSVVVNGWNPDTAPDGLAAMRESLRGAAALGVYVRPDRVAGSPAETIGRYAELGVDELHLYHLGLLNRSSLAVAQELVAACHERNGSGAGHGD